MVPPVRNKEAAADWNASTLDAVNGPTPASLAISSGDSPSKRHREIVRSAEDGRKIPPLRVRKYVSATRTFLTVSWVLATPFIANRKHLRISISATSSTKSIARPVCAGAPISERAKLMIVQRSTVQR